MRLQSPPGPRLPRRSTPILLSRLVDTASINSRAGCGFRPRLEHLEFDLSPATLSSLSDALVSVSIVIYSLALIGYSAELGFGRRRAPTPAEMAVAGPHGASPIRPPQRPDDAESAATESYGDRPRLGAALGRIAVGLTVLAATAQAGVLVTRGLATERLPWGNVYEFSTAVVLVAVVAFLGTLHRVPGSRRLGAFVVGPAALALVLIGLLLYTPAGPLVAALRSAWLAVHVSAAVLGFGVFMVSGIANALYLLRLRVDAARAQGAAETTPSRSPSATTFDRVGHRTAVFGFPIWTFAVIAGAIWAESAWGRFWGWDPKETWAFIAWVIYAAYLHARSTAGWGGRPAAWINLIGLAAMIFNLLYVNYVSTGLHSYAR